MAEIRIRHTNERISGEENVRAFLEQQEVLYEHWSPAKLPAELDNKFVKIRRSKPSSLHNSSAGFATVPPNKPLCRSVFAAVSFTTSK